jgi:hypothetical protein
MGQQYSLHQRELQAHFHMRLMMAKWELIFQFQCLWLSSLSQDPGHHLPETKTSMGGCCSLLYTDQDGHITMERQWPPRCVYGIPHFTKGVRDEILGCAVLQRMTCTSCCQAKLGCNHQDSESKGRSKNKCTSEMMKNESIIWFYWWGAG